MQISPSNDSEPAQGSSLVDQYLVAPPAIKNKARSAIGAKNDDAAIKLINQSSDAAATVSAILAEADPESSVLASPAPTAAEDVMYPRRA